MSENYRPERRPINPAQSALDAAGTPHPLQGSQNAREALSQELSNEPIVANQNVQGTPPPEFTTIMQKKGVVASAAPKGPRLSNESQILQTDHLLEDLVARMRDKVNTYEKIVLPSLGRFYEGTETPGDGVIHIRPMTGQEEQILATPRFVKRGTAIDMIFNNCIQESVNSAKLLSVDRTYLLIYLRGISYSPAYDVEVKCPNCGAKFTYTIDLNALEFETCPDDFGPNSLTGVLPKTGLTFKYRLAIGEDEQAIQEYRDRKLKNGFDNNSGQADDSFMYRTAIMIEDIGGLTNKYQIQALIKQMPIGDVSHLRNVINTPPFGVNTKVEIQCPSCLHEFEIDTPFETSFFFPQGKKKTRA